MQVKHLIRKLQLLKPELQEKDIFVIGGNGLLMPPDINFTLKDYNKTLDKSKENVLYVVLR